MATTQRHKRVVLVGPEGALRCDAPEEIRFWTLPHPRSHAPAYYLPYHRSHDPSSSTKPDGVLELQTLKSERTPQSWFLAPPVDQHLSVQHDRLTSSRRRTFIRPGSEQNSVLKDGALQVLSPIDPFFLVLGLVTPIWATERSYLTLEDALERASQHFGSQLGGKADEQWDDILAFGETDLGQAAVDRCCETQDVGGQQVYRLNQDKVLEEIRTKVDRLATDVTAFDRAPDTLGRAYYRIYDDDQAKDHESLPGDTPEQRKELWARREVVLSTLAAWLDPEWVQAARESLGLMA